MFRTLSLAGLLILVFAQSSPGESSALWGEAGERWSPESRLPDFSFAGYRRGEAAIPSPEVTHNVRDFGAVGDGVQDDSDAFINALAAMDSGVLFVPEGRYVIGKRITIRSSNVVLRGTGPEKSTLYFPNTLTDLEPNWGATTSGRPTSNYSWSGGFLTIQGGIGNDVITAIQEPADRGAFSVTVEDASALSVGQEVEIRQEDNADNSLADHLYSSDSAVSLDKIKGRTRASLVARIVAIEGRGVTLDRPLRFDVRAMWKPVLHQFEPKVTESGIESLRFEFPNTPYAGHFTELGFNAFALSGTAHCWVRNVHIHNSDSGGFVTGTFNTVDGVVLSSERSADKGRQSTGHHGIEMGGNDNLLTNFDFQTEFIHDITVSHCAGNVSSNGRGVNLSLDHHCRAPYENLFTNIDAGAGARIWRCGGGADLGAHCGARGTFWNIRTTKPVPPPDKKFGPWSLNLVGIWMDIPDATPVDGRWYESSGNTFASPVNIHEAQLKKRIEAKAAVK